jgi:hypothetical protein
VLVAACPVAATAAGAACWLTVWRGLEPGFCGVASPWLAVAGAVGTGRGAAWPTSASCASTDVNAPAPFFALAAAMFGGAATATIAAAYADKVFPVVRPMRRQANSK